MEEEETGYLSYNPDILKKRLPLVIDFAILK